MSDKIDLARWKELAEAVKEYDAEAWRKGEWSQRNATVEAERLVAYSSPARVLALIAELEQAIQARDFHFAAANKYCEKLEAANEELRKLLNEQ